MTLKPNPLWLMEAADQSGVTSAARHLAAGVFRSGMRLTIFTLRAGEGVGEFAQIGCPLHIFPHMGGWVFGKTAVLEAAKRGINLVHALSPTMAKRGMRLAKRLGAPFVVTANRLDEGEYSRLVGFSGAGVIAVSDAIKERLANVAGIGQDKIRVIPNGLDLTCFPRPEFMLPSDRQARIPVVGTLGHLSERKGQRVFLQAVKELVEQGVDAEFMVLGDGPDRAALRNLAGELGIAKRVTFTPQSVSGQLSQLDLLVEPSFQEGLGLSVMQAMAAGVPVVASGVGGLYSLIEDGKTGLMFQVGDHSGLAKAMRRLLDRRDERLDLARQAREMLEEKFNADLIASRLGDFYLKCLKETGGDG